MTDAGTKRRTTLARCLLIASLGCVVAVSSHLFTTQTAQASSKSDRALGAKVFHEKGCEFCHGVDGIGTERAPDLSGVGRKLHPEQIQKQIHDGDTRMPAFGEALTSDEIQQLVAFLSAKKKKPTKT
jgi:mono/diheme cytochrome c family protein